MAWNKYYLFVKSPKLTNINQILLKLGLAQYRPTRQAPLHCSNKPETLFTGFYKDSFPIIHPDLAFHFFENISSETEKLFLATFPGSEIVALIENSTVGLFGYAIIENGQKIRVREGSDGEIYHDAGALLPEERQMLAAELFAEDEIEKMREDGMSEEEVAAAIQFEASWRVPNLLTKRYLGETVGAIDTGEVPVMEYSL